MYNAIPRGLSMNASMTFSGAGLLPGALPYVDHQTIPATAVSGSKDQVCNLRAKKVMLSCILHSQGL
jgi:hypothetical protein